MALGWERITLKESGMKEDFLDRSHIELRDEYALEGYLKIFASNNNFVSFKICETDDEDKEVEVTMDYEQIPKIIALLKEGLWHKNNTCYCSAYMEGECGCGNYLNNKTYPE